VVRPALAAAAGEEDDPITLIDKDTYQSTLDGAGSSLVCLDFYTDWCGPCKLAYPTIVEFAKKYDDVVFLKMNCNEYNKPLAKELGIRVAPTFHFYKNGEQIDKMTGAKTEELEKLILKNR